MLNAIETLCCKMEDNRNMHNAIFLRTIESVKIASIETKQECYNLVMRHLEITRGTMSNLLALVAQIKRDIDALQLDMEEKQEIMRSVKIIDGALQDWKYALHAQTLQVAALKARYGFV